MRIIFTVHYKKGFYLICTAELKLTLMWIKRVTPLALLSTHSQYYKGKQQTWEPYYSKKDQEDNPKRKGPPVTNAIVPVPEM